MFILTRQQVAVAALGIVILALLLALQAPVGLLLADVLATGFSLLFITLPIWAEHEARQRELLAARLTGGPYITFSLAHVGLHDVIVRRTDLVNAIQGVTHTAHALNVVQRIVPTQGATRMKFITNGDQSVVVFMTVRGPGYRVLMPTDQLIDLLINTDQ